MKDYAFLTFAIPAFVNGKTIAVHVNKKDDTQFMLTHETTNKVLKKRFISSTTEYHYFLTLVGDALQTKGVGAAYDAAVAYING